MTKRLTINLTINLLPLKNEAGAPLPKPTELAREPKAHYLPRVDGLGFDVYTKEGVLYLFFWHERSAKAMVDHMNNSKGGIGDWNRSQITRRTR